MHTLLPDLIPGQLWLVSVPRGSTRLLLNLTARLALDTPVRVLDCGNCFNVYPVARTLGRYTPDVNAALERINVARAFTCYQVSMLLESVPEASMPTLVLDMLATFYDDSASLDERQRLLRRAVTQLHRLRRKGRVMVSAYMPPPEASQAMPLYTMLEEAADRIWRLESPAPASPLRLL